MRTLHLCCALSRALARVCLCFLDNPLEFVGIREHVVNHLRRRNVERVAGALGKGDGALSKGPRALRPHKRMKTRESERQQT